MAGLGVGLQPVFQSHLYPPELLIQLHLSCEDGQSNFKLANTLNSQGELST